VRSSPGDAARRDGRDDDEVVAAGGVLHRRRAGPAGAAPSRFEQEDGLSAHAAEDPSARASI
jgi:hypothetical protein